MRLLLLFIILSVSATASTSDDRGNTLSTVSPAATALDLDNLQTHFGQTYNLQGTIHYIAHPHDWFFAIDLNGRILPVVREEPHWKKFPLSTGDVISFSGKVGTTAMYSQTPLLRCSSHTLLGRVSEAPAREVDPAQLRKGTCDFTHIRLRGTVKDFFHDPKDPNYYSIVLRCGTTLVSAAYRTDGRDPITPVDLIGAEVELKGQFLPQSITSGGIRQDPCLSLRTPADIRILRPAPFWTPAKLLLALLALFALFLGAIVWNVALHRLSERRGRALAAESIAVIQSELKTAERTRLAAELHDAMSQTLSGISMQIEAAARNFDSNRPLSLHRLNLAARTLKSCRDELRNCLWDLRSDTLDETDMNRAICRTLEPHLDGTKLTVRFRVPREEISEVTCHTILKIVRELSVNAIRHGRATHLKIAGSRENGLFMFSVWDNGTGFDPAVAPGIREGHFGLQGIRERIENFGGSLKIDSAPGKGTHVIITLKAPTART